MTYANFRALSTALLVCFFHPAADAGLMISSDSNVIAGRNAFIAGGTSQTQFDWDLVSVGSYASRTVNGNSVVGANAHSTPLNIRNWVDAAGFGGHDLAINGVESFDLQFAADHKSVGLAIITGTGNFSGEYDLTGATFRFTAFDARNSQIGIADFSLASGRIDQAWLTLNATSGFRRLEVREIGAASIADQYFSDIFTSVDNVNPVPEPASFGLWALAAGIGLVGARRSKRIVVC